MIELKKLKKIYKPKNGVEVVALNEVNLKLPKKGMIFVLGKSGSGKSTLLNLLGGLDNYDSGEIIIKDKSSNDFSKDDFDSYRNTYLGFIFQEYNILDEFSVKDNISLAIELQGLKPSVEIVNEVLKQVDLEGLGNRKPRELSGGQKQRVAIARALVKNPEIILADEPTGSLDSETGALVLETLKELSKNKLVIVVSHDTEYAKKYADRIIEFKDGTIISDTIKEDIPTETNDKFELKKSKLGIKNSFKIGISSLKFKPIRLIVTVLLSFLSFTLFGITDTMGSYDKIVTTTESIIDANLATTAYEKIKLIESDNYTYEKKVKFTDEDIKLLESKSNLQVLPVFDMYNNQSFNNIYNFYNSINTVYYSFLFNNATAITSEICDDFGYELTGRLPQNKDEIVITEYTLNLFIDCGLLQNGVEEVINNENDILGKEITFYNYELSTNKYSTVVGVIDTNFNYFEYEELKNETGNSSLGLSFYNELSIDLHNSVFVHEDLLPSLDSKSFDFNGSVNQVINGVSFYNDFSSVSTDLISPSFVELNKSLLYDNEVLISQYYFYTLFSDEINIYKNNIYNNGGSNIIDAYVASLTNQEVLGALNWSSDFEDMSIARTQLSYMISINFTTSINGLKSGLCIIVESGVLSNLTVDITLDYLNEYTQDYEAVQVRVVGITQSNTYYDKTLIVSSTLIDEIGQCVDNGKVDFVMTAIPKSTSDLKSIVEFSYEYNDGIRFGLSNIIQDNIEFVSGFIENSTTIFLGIGIFFAIFSSLLFFNFINISITHKQREIGILRALGARSKDVFKIFFSETIIIGLINFILASISIFISSSFLNIYLSDELGLGVSLLYPGIRQVLLVFIIMICISFISSFLPVYKISTKRPIESIRKV